MPKPQTPQGSSPPTDWYKMTLSASAKEAEINIYDQIGQSWSGEGVSAKQFAKDLKALGPVQTITVRINSPGGSAFDGSTIYNLLRAHPARIEVVVDGLAASAASVIAMAGDHIAMPENSVMMIHNPSNICWGTATEMRKMAEVLDKVRDASLTSYKHKTGLSEAELIKLLDDETWMTAADAHALGFADSIEAPVKAAASLLAFGSGEEWQQRFQRVPSHLLTKAPVLTEDVPKGEDSPMPPVENTPAAASGMISLTTEQLNQLVADQVKASMTPAIAQLNEARLDAVRARFQTLVGAGNLTPAQNKLFVQLAETLFTNSATLTFSVKEDGSEAQTGSAVDALFALATTMQHGLLKEQVAASDAPVQKEATAQKPVQTWSPDLSNVPYEQSGNLEGVVMDQFIRQVVMVENPSLKYGEAALLAEKDARLADAIRQHVSE